MTCPYCSGTFWLNDTRAHGPCVCCTPEAMEALEALEVERDGLTEQLDHANTRLGEAWDKVLENPDVQREGKSLAEATDQALDLAYEQGQAEIAAARDAFQRWLIRNGLPAVPVRLDDPDLDALADALF